MTDRDARGGTASCLTTFAAALAVVLTLRAALYLFLLLVPA